MKSARLYNFYYSPVTNLTSTWAKDIQLMSPSLRIRPIPPELPEIILKKYLVLGVLIFDNATISPPRNKFAATMKFQTQLATCDLDKSQHQGECYWLTRCSGVLSAAEKVAHSEVDYYFRENFAQIYHMAFKSWLRDHIEADYAAQSDEHTQKLRILDAKFVVKSLIIPQQGNHCHREMTTVSVWYIGFFIFFLSYIHLILVSICMNSIHTRDRDVSLIYSHTLHIYYIGVVVWQ